MKAIIDLVLLGILVICAWNGYKKGLIMGVGGILCIIIGIYGANLLANTFYHDAHNLDGCCDYIMANPPFNLKGWYDEEKLKNDYGDIFTEEEIDNVRKGAASNAIQIMEELIKNSK